jgi:2-keto-4-pentenoate hydratase/2-oxohepta-3-ene-1,7-dioic acid hydratase in catechol pathway
MKLYRVIDSRGHMVYATGAPDIMFRVDGDIFGEYAVTDKKVKVAKILAPLAPVMIFAIGLNYRAHALETHKPIPDAPVVFAKSVASVLDPGEAIRLPAAGPACVDYECELAVVIGRTCRNVPAGEARQYILGYTVANDVSARDWQARLGQWVRAKSFDTFCPLGPCIDTELDPANLRLSTTLNGQVMQDSNTSDLICDVPHLVEYLSRDLTLLPGTLILTGTPGGVGVARQPQVFLRPDDTVVCKIDGLGELANTVALADGAILQDERPPQLWGT